MNETPNTLTAESFDAMVDAYETWAEPLTARLAQVALKRTSVRAGDSVLDIGAGTGALALQAAAFGAKVTAVDLSSDMVARLAQRLAPYPECKALVMDGQALTFEESTFDAAFSILSTTLFGRWGVALDEAVRVVRPGGWIGIVHWASPQGSDIFTIFLRALKKLALPTDSPDASKLTELSAHELRAVLEDRKCEVMEVELLDAPGPLPTPENFMDTLDPFYRIHPTYRSLDERLRGELRILLAEETRRWIKEDVPAGRTAKVHLALARRS
jgi:ubiquinone/menaquinone biosynthesis C-methylase UbiE